MKLHLPRRRVWRAAIYIGSFALVVMALDLVLGKVRQTIRPGYSTTRLVAPLLPDGSIDYLQATDDRFGKGVTAQNNAAVPFLQAIGRVGLSPQQPVDGITDRLGMPHLAAAGDYFVMYQEYCDKHSAKADDDPFAASDPSDGAASPTTGPTTSSSITEQWVEANEKPLALFIEASNRSRFFIPYNAGSRPDVMIAILLPYLNPMRDAGRALRTRALLRLDANDIDGFRRDMLAVHRLARLVAQEPTLVDNLVGMVMEISACRAERAAAASGKLSAQQLRSLAQELASMGELSSIADRVDAGERIIVLDALQAASRRGLAWILNAAVGDQNSKGQLRTSAEYAGARFVPVPWEQTMQRMNGFYDGAVTALNQTTYPQRAAALQLWHKEIEEIAWRNHYLSLVTPDWPTWILLPSLNRALGRCEIARMENRLTQVVFALAAYKIEHSEYPGTLMELSPEDLRSVPNDIFCEKPLIYFRNGSGYTLYSVGPNMIDDGGKNAAPADDVVASLP